MTKTAKKPAAKAAKSNRETAPAKAPVAKKATAKAASKRSAKATAPVQKAATITSTASKPAKAKVNSSPKQDIKTMTTFENKAVNETIEQMTTAGNQAFKEGFEKSLKSVNEINAFHKDNVEAVIESSTIAGKQAETLNANAVAYAKTSMESAVAATKALTTAKSVQDMIEVQTDFVKSSMDMFLAELNKTSDLYAGAVKDVTKPINDRFAASVEMVQSAR